MRCYFLASGSSGNCTALVNDNDEILLIDCGIAISDIKNKLEHHGLEQTHGVHLHAGDASGAGVHDLAVVHGGRGGEDEQALLLPLIHHRAHRVPQHRGHLPLIDEPRVLAPQQQGGLGAGGGQIPLSPVRVLHPKHALCLLLARGGLAAPLRAYD